MLCEKKMVVEDNLKLLETSNKYKDLEKVLMYYSILDDYESINRVVNMKDNINSDKLNSLLNYYRCLLANNKNDAYVKDKIFYSLPSDYKICFNISIEKNIIGLSNIFEKDIKKNLKKWMKKNNLLTYKMYFAYFFDKKQSIQKVEKNMKKNFLNVLEKKNIDLIELDYIVFLIDLYRKIHIVNIEDSKFIELLEKKLTLMKKMSYKVLNTIECHEKILGNKKKIYIDIVCNFLQLLIRKINEENEIKEIIGILNKYQTKDFEFIDKISKIKPDDYDEKIFIDEVERIINSKIDKSISTIISLYSSKKVDIDMQKKFINKLDKIKKECANDSYKKDIDIGIEEYKFWNGEKFDLSKIDGTYYTNLFLKCLIEYDNKKISYNDFLERINKIGKIDSYIINRWDRIEKIFKNDNIDWLISIIIHLNDISTHDYNLLLMLEKRFKKILNSENTELFLSDFTRLESAVSCIDNDFNFCYYSSLIYIIKYRVFDENCRNLVTMTLNKFIPKIKEKYEIVKKYLYTVAQALIIHSENEILNDLLLTSENYLSKNDYLIIYSATIYANHKINLNTYLDCIMFLNEIYTENIEINQDMYIILSCTANKIITGEIIFDYEYLNKLNLDKSNIKSEYYQNLEEIFHKHLEKFDNKNEILSILLQKIYLKNIEKFNAGIVVKFNNTASGQEIVNELGKAIGRDKLLETQKQICDGVKISQPWLNVLQVHDIFKFIQKNNNVMFKITKNKFFVLEDCIIQPTSLILLSKLNLLSKVSNETHSLVFNSLATEIRKLKEYNIVDFGEIYENSQVAYDQLLGDCYDFIENLPDERIIFVSNANILGLKDIDKINKYDVDVLKQIFIQDRQILFITDDPFYLDSSTFKNNFFSTFSYVLSLYFNKIIDSNDLYKCVQLLIEMNYNVTVDKNIYRYLLECADDENIKKILEIIY